MNFMDAAVCATHFGCVFEGRPWHKKTKISWGGPFSLLSVFLPCLIVHRIHTQYINIRSTNIQWYCTSVTPNQPLVFSCYVYTICITVYIVIVSGRPYILLYFFIFPLSLSVSQSLSLLQYNITQNCISSDSEKFIWFCINCICGNNCMNYVYQSDGKRARHVFCQSEPPTGHILYIFNCM